MTFQKRRFSLVLFLTLLYPFLPKLVVFVPGSPLTLLVNLMWFFVPILSLVVLGLAIWQRRKGGLQFFNAEKAINFLYVYYFLALLFNLFLPLFLR